MSDRARAAETSPTLPRRDYAGSRYDVDGVHVEQAGVRLQLRRHGPHGQLPGFTSRMPSGTREEVNMNVRAQQSRVPDDDVERQRVFVRLFGPADSAGLGLRGVREPTFAKPTRIRARSRFPRRGCHAPRVHGQSPADGAPWTTARREARPQFDSAATGYGTDLWSRADESGWGLNLIEQGDTRSARSSSMTRPGRPRWYSASNLTYEQVRPPDSGQRLQATLSRRAGWNPPGPISVTTFNAAAVQRPPGRHPEHRLLRQRHRVPRLTPSTA
jgi:hypothetical protein